MSSSELLPLFLNQGGQIDFDSWPLPPLWEASDNNLLFLPRVDDPDLGSKGAELTFVARDLEMLHRDSSHKITRILSAGYFIYFPSLIFSEVMGLMSPSGTACVVRLI